MILKHSDGPIVIEPTRAMLFLCDAMLNVVETNMTVYWFHCFNQRIEKRLEMARR